MKKKKIQNFILFLQQLLGIGSFGKVYRGVEENTKKIVAIKVLLKKQIEKDIYIKNALFSQIKIMRNMSSPNIVGFIDVLQTSNNYYIVQQYCNGGDLRRVMKYKKIIPQYEALHYLEGILNGFIQLILRGITHRDVKPENILLHDKVVKIADFGFSKNIISKSILFGSIVGTPLYMAPQILRQQRYSAKCDIWAIGMIYYEMLYGKLPWVGNSQNELLTNIMKIPLIFNKQRQVSQMSRNFISGCLKIKQSDRYDWQQIYNHALFNNKFEHFTNKNKRLQQRALYIINNLRVVVHSENINLEKLFQNLKLTIGASLKKSQFYDLLMTLDDKITKDQIGILFDVLDPQSKGVIDFCKFKNRLTQNGINLKSIIPQINSPTDLEGNKVIQIIIKLNEKVENYGLDLHNIFSSYDHNKNDALQFSQFAKLLWKIDTTLKTSEVELCFKKFDTNNDGKITFQQFYRTICKITGYPVNYKKKK